MLKVKATLLCILYLQTRTHSSIAWRKNARKLLGEIRYYTPSDALRGEGSVLFDGCKGLLFHQVYCFNF